MLIALKDQLKGFMLWAIIILISIPFLLWGIQEYIGGSAEVNALTVNDREISMREFDRGLAQLRQQAMQQFGGQLPPGYGETQLRQQVVDNLVNLNLLEEVVEDNQFYTSNQQIIEELRSYPQFQVDGQFDREVYGRVVSSLGMSRSEFELRLANILKINQFENGLQRSSFITPAALQQFAALSNQQRNIDYVVIPQNSIGDIEVSDEDIAQYYETNQESFRTPERAKAEYLVVDRTTFEEATQIDDAELMQIYETGKANGEYVEPAVYSASHILLSVDEEADDDTRAERRAAIEAIKARIDAGESFAAIAEAESEDPGSAAQGGSLGEIQPGIMVAPFEEAVYALTKEGQVSAPIETVFGYHLIKLDSIKPKKELSFEEVKQDIADNTRRNEADKLYFDATEQLTNLTFEDPESLVGAADELGLEIQTTDWLTRTNGDAEHPVTNEASVRQALFNEEVLLEGNNSSVINVNDNQAVVVRLADYEASEIMPLEDAREQIVTTLESNQRRRRLLEAAEALLAEVEASDAMTETAAAQANGQLSTGVDVTRQATEVPNMVVQRAFTTPAGQAAIVDLTNQDIAVVKVNRIVPGDFDTLSEAEKTSLQQQLRITQSNQVNAAFIQAVKERADIIRNESLELDQTFDLDVNLSAN